MVLTPTFTTEDKASNPGWGTKLLQAMGGEGQKNKREREREKDGASKKINKSSKP